MKYLQRLSLCLAFITAMFSCKKEYSVETPAGLTNNPAAQWEFKEAGVQFNGPIDSVAIDTISTYTFLTINGKSADGTTQFTLQAFGTTIQKGVYKTPFSLFAYIKGAAPVYQTDQAATDSFTIVITKADSSSIAGTFSGLAKTGSVSKTIVDGKFSAPLKISTNPPVPGATPDSGQVVLWSKAGCGGGASTTPITVIVNGKSGQITSFISTEPGTCDPTGSYILKLPVGTYPWVAKCGTDSVAGMVTVTKGGCTKQQVDFTAAVLTGDYFPMTTSSNWTYLYEASSADDTLFTLSTGSSKPFGGKSYSLFTNSDGISKDTSYYRKSGNAYYEYVAAATQKDSASGLSISFPAFEYIFLKDNLAANDTYTNGPFSGTATLPGIPIPTAITASSKSTILETGSTVTVTGVTYANVIKIKTIYSYTIAGTASDIYGVEQWFSKGVGLIKYIDYDTAPFTTASYIKDITRSKVY